MDNSLDSSPETPTQGPKSIFKKPSNFYQAFQVSMDESVSAPQSSNLDLDVDTTLATDKVIPFKKSRNTVQQSFNITSDDSLLNSETESSVTCSKPQELFHKKNKTLLDFFSVTCNETNTPPNNLGETIDSDDSVTNVKENLFRKKNQSKNKITVSNESFIENFGEKENIEQSPVLPDSQTSGNEADSTTFVTKSNPFKKSSRKSEHSPTQMEISVTESNETSVQKQNSTLNNSRALPESTISERKSNSFQENSSVHNNTSSVPEERSVSSENNAEQTPNNTSVKNISKQTNNTKNASMVSITKETSVSFENNADQTPNNTSVKNISKQTNNTKNASMVSITEERSGKTADNNAVLINPKETPEMTLDKNISRRTNNTTSFLEQSSINDDNLNGWMSDHSDEELMPPPISSPTGNLSHTAEKQNSLNAPQEEVNPLSVWQQKFNEIVSNVEKKTHTTQLISESSKKPKLMKKSNLNNEKAKQIENVENKYKPPKLLKPAPFATKKLYNYIIKKLQPKYGIDTRIESENIVASICDTVKKVIRKKNYQKKLVQDLKKEMAKAGLIETTMDFYEFIIKFLPYSFRVKVVPCLQPVTNVVYPPKEVINPFDKIL